MPSIKKRKAGGNTATEDACELSNVWYEGTPAKNYIKRSDWYSLPCYKRIEIASNPYYFVNAEAVRKVNEVTHVEGVGLESAESSVEDAAQEASDEAEGIIGSVF